MNRLNRLQSLGITLTYNTDGGYFPIDTKQLHFDPNKLFPNLREFTWRAFCTYHLNIKGLELIGPQIASKLKYLGDFGLGFRHEIAKVKIQELSQCLATLNTDLNCLNFTNNCRKLANQKVLLSQLSLPRLKKLQTLSLEFNHCEGITSRFLADLAQICAKNFAGLRFLSLSFEPDRDENGGEVLSFLKKIFGNEMISDRGIKNFAKILSERCQDLEILSLNFINFWEISDSGVKALCQKLEKLKKLKTIRMAFFNCGHVTRMGCEEAAKLLGIHRQVHISEGAVRLWRYRAI